MGFGIKKLLSYKNWPMEVKNAVKSIISNDSWLSDRDAEANIEFYSPKWLRLDPEASSANVLSRR